MLYERDVNQRQFGCFGFSVLLHALVLTMLILAPALTIPPQEIQEGNGQLVYMDLPPAKGSPTAADSKPLSLPPTPEVKPRLEETKEANAIVVAPAPAKIKPPVAATKKPVAKKAVAAKPLPAKVAPKHGDVAIDAEEPIREEEETIPPEENELAKEVIDDREEAAALAAAAEEESRRAMEEAEREKQIREETARAEEREKEEQRQAQAREEEIAAKAAALAAAEESRRQAEAQAAQNRAAQAAAASAAAARANQQSTAAVGGQGTGNSPATRVTGTNGAQGTANGIRDSSQLREYPGNRKPEYPERDALLRNQGSSVFVAYVNADGTVRNVQLERSASSASLDAAAVEAFRRWRFMPGQEGWVRKSFDWKLNGEEQFVGGRLRRQ